MLLTGSFNGASCHNYFACDVIKNSTIISLVSVYYKSGNGTTKLLELDCGVPSDLGLDCGIPSDLGLEGRHARLQRLEEQQVDVFN